MAPAMANLAQRSVICGARNAMRDARNPIKLNKNKSAKIPGFGNTKRIIR